MTEHLISLTQLDSITRDRMADAYGHAIYYYFEGTDWAAVNRAIIERWSVSALKYIKRKAWNE